LIHYYFLINISVKKLKKLTRCWVLLKEILFTFPVTVSLFVSALFVSSLVRSHLEYANNVWCPKRKTDVDKLERVQKRATKLIPGLSKKSYSDRLKALNLPTLKYRRYRRDCAVGC